MSNTNEKGALQAALTQFAQCISVLAGDDRTRHEVMVEESRPILKAALAALASHEPEHGGWKHYPSYKDATVALAQGNYFTGIKVNGVAFAYFMEHDGSVTAMKLPVASPFATHGEGK